MTIELYKNTFVTLDEAKSYFEDRFESGDWFALTDDIKEKLLISASRKINRFDYTGCVLSEEQPMEFPRNFEMPQDIKDAVCEEAISICQSADDIHLKNQHDNISSISLGAGSVSYSTSGNNAFEQRLLSKTAEYLVRKWTKKGYNIYC